MPRSAPASATPAASARKLGHPCQRPAGGMSPKPATASLCASHRVRWRAAPNRRDVRLPPAACASHHRPARTDIFHVDVLALRRSPRAYCAHTHPAQNEPDKTAARQAYNRGVTEYNLGRFSVPSPSSARLPAGSAAPCCSSTLRSQNGARATAGGPSCCTTFLSLAHCYPHPPHLAARSPPPLAQRKPPRPASWPPGFERALWHAGQGPNSFRDRGSARLKNASRVAGLSFLPHTNVCIRLSNGRRQGRAGQRFRWRWTGSPSPAVADRTRFSGQIVYGRRPHPAPVRILASLVCRCRQLAVLSLRPDWRPSSFTGLARKPLPWSAPAPPVPLPAGQPPLPFDHARSPATVVALRPTLVIARPGFDLPSVAWLTAVGVSAGFGIRFSTLNAWVEITSRSLRATIRKLHVGPRGKRIRSSRVAAASTTGFQTSNSFAAGRSAGISLRQ